MNCDMDMLLCVRSANSNNCIIIYLYLSFLYFQTLEKFPIVQDRGCIRLKGRC